MKSLQPLFTVIKFTMKDILSRKSFRISTIVILILIVLGFNVPNIINNINGGDFSDTILISDPENIFEGSLETLTKNESLSDKPVIEPISYDDLKSKVDNDEVASAIFIEKQNDEIKFHYIVRNTIALTNLPQGIIEQLTNLYTNVEISKLDLTEKQLANIYPNFDFVVEQTETEEIGGNIFAMMMLSCVLFFAIYFCAYQVSSSITIEKTSRIIETLVTSTSPTNIILGKTIGIGLVGLLQVILFAVTAILSAYAFLNPELLSSLFDLSSFTPYLAIIAILYFILGYFMYALLYALTGSTVSKPEDIQSANTPIALLTMFAFYLAYFTLTDPTGSLNVFASLFPFSSPFCMPLRVMMGVANGWDVLLSIIILIATCAIVARIAIKVYSSAILNYGSRMNLKDIIKTYKEK